MDRLTDKGGRECRGEGGEIERRKGRGGGDKRV